MVFKDDTSMKAAQDALGTIESSIGGGQPNRQDLKRTERRAVRSGQVAVAVSILISIVALYLAYRAGQSTARTEARAEVNESSLAALTQANNELRRQGLPPLPVPQPGSDVDLNALAQAAAARVMANISDDPSFRGAPGVPGRDGIPGLSPPCLMTPTVCQGPQGVTGVAGVSGPSGANGTDGAPGENGKNGVNGPPGAACEPAIPECRGPQGPPGVSGPQGPPGAAGSPPTSWTYTDLLGMHTCSRNNEDDSHPTYACI